ACWMRSPTSSRTARTSATRTGWTTPSTPTRWPGTWSSSSRCARRSSLRPISA
ncbi:unnamed protein product, partial [Prorocentrum cordatum]